MNYDKPTLLWIGIKGANDVANKADHKRKNISTRTFQERAHKPKCTRRRPLVIDAFARNALTNQNARVVIQ